MVSPLRCESCCGKQRLSSKDVACPICNVDEERGAAHSEAQVEAKRKRERVD